MQYPSQTRPTHPDSEHVPKTASWRQEALGLCHFSESPGLMSLCLAASPSPGTVCFMPGSALLRAQCHKLWALIC